jgi:rhamnosyl/mannosyltransferase
MEAVVASLCRGLIGRGVDCRVVVASDGNGSVATRDCGVRVRHMRSFGMLDSMPICPEALSVLRTLDVDVINLHHPNPLADISFLASNARARLVVTYHSDIVRQRTLGMLHGPLLRRTLRRADAIVATSPQYAASSPVLRDFRDKIHIIPLGLTPPPPAGWRAPFDGSPAGPQYLFVGRLVAYKGIPILLEALRRVPGCLWIAGSGPLQGELRALAVRLGLRRRVELLGDVSEEEKLRRLSQCDAVVLPSTTRAEAFGIVLLEAMAMARPVVVSDLPTGVQMLVEEGANGYLFTPGSAAALADALRRLAAGPARAREMGEEGRRRLLDRWTTEHMVQRYVRLYERLCVPQKRPEQRPAPIEPARATRT